jgi:hypothetical protein
VQTDDNFKSDPVKNRGHYFDGAAYWSVDIASKPFYIHHSFTILSWIKTTVNNSNQTILSKNKSNVSATGTENLISFGVDQQNVRFIMKDGANAIFDQTTDSNNGIVTMNTWAYVAVTVDFAVVNRSSTVVMWLND